MSLPVIQVLIAEDSNAFREGLRDLLRAVSDMRIVGEASTGAEAVRLAKHLQPDVILMDLQMPDMNGIEATRRILRTSPHIAILVLTMFDDDASVFAAMQAGARGYLLKGALKNEMLRAIRGVVAGDAIFGPAVAQRMATYFSRMQPAAANAFPMLTEREQGILMLVVQRFSNQEIAQQLQISVKTVRNHLSNIYGKLQVRDRAEAIIRAKDAGLNGESL